MKIKKPSRPSCNQWTRRRGDQGLRCLATRRRPPSSSSPADSGCHDDAWPLWTYNSAYQRKAHAHSVLQCRSSAWRRFENCGQEEILHYRQVYADLHGHLWLLTSLVKLQESRQLACQRQIIYANTRSGTNDGEASYILIVTSTTSTCGGLVLSMRAISVISPHPLPRLILHLWSINIYGNIYLNYYCFSERCTHTHTHTHTHTRLKQPVLYWEQRLPFFGLMNCMRPAGQKWKMAFSEGCQVCSRKSVFWMLPKLS